MLKCMNHTSKHAGNVSSKVVGYPFPKLHQAKAGAEAIFTIDKTLIALRTHILCTLSLACPPAACLASYACSPSQLFLVLFYHSCTA